MQAAVNPLRRTKPAKARCSLRGRFYFTDEKGRLDGGIGQQVCLTSEELWIMPELSIPLHLIGSVRILSRRGLPPRRYVQVAYLNPITNAPEAIYLCKPDPVGIGLYRVKPIQELADRIVELARRRAATISTSAAPDPPAALDRCEVCGAEPAYYVPYLFLVSAVLVCYRSPIRRRIHCRKHNVLHGFAHYFLTVLTGWIGIGIVAYPFVVFAAARNLAPALGRSSVVLGVLPTIALAALVLHWVL